MKKTILIAKLKSFLILIVIALALTFTSCPEDDNNGGNGTGGGGGGGGGNNWKWTAVSNSTFGYGDINGIAYGNNRWVAVGPNGRMAYSEDNGITWTAVANIWQYIYSGDQLTVYINAIAYGIANGESVGRFVAVGSGGKMAYSDNGSSWKAVSNSTFPATYTSIGTTTAYLISAIACGIADGESVGRFVAVGNGGKMAYSDDGVTWTAVSNSTIWQYGTYSDGSPRISDIYGITYGNNRFVAVGYSGKMAYSSDGVTWTAVSDSTFGAYGISAITYGNNRFIAVGGQGKMAYSDDNGETWTAVSNSTFGTSGIGAIAYGNNRFVAVGGGGKMAYSDDNGVTWTAVSNSTIWQNGTYSDGSQRYSYIEAIAYGNNRFVAVGDNGKMAYADW